MCVCFLQEEVDVFSDVLSEKLQNLFGVFAVTGRGLSCAEQTWSCPGKRRAAGSGMFKSSSCSCFSVQQRMLKRRCDVTSLRANKIDFRSRPFVFLPRFLNRRQLQLANVQCFADWCNVNLIDVCAEACIYKGWLLRIFLQLTTHNFD